MQAKFYDAQNIIDHFLKEKNEIVYEFKSDEIHIIVDGEVFASVCNRDYYALAVKVIQKSFMLCSIETTIEICNFLLEYACHKDIVYRIKNKTIEIVTTLEGDEVTFYATNVKDLIMDVLNNALA